MKKITFLIATLWANCLQAQELIPYRSGELWGYCTPDKKIVIEPQFEFASWFYEGLARVANYCNYDCYDLYDGKWGYIDTKGNVVIPIQYDAGFDFIKGYSFVRKDTTWYKINTKGEIIDKFSSPNYYDVFSFKELQPYLNSEIPYKNYTLVDGPYQKGNNKFESYKINNIEYWENPERLFFFPIDTIVNDVLLMYVDEYNHVSNRRIDIFDLAKSISPAIIVIKNQSNEIKAVKSFKIIETQKDYLLNQLKQDINIKARLNTLLSAYPNTKFFKISDFKEYQNTRLSNNEKMVLSYPIQVPVKNVENYLFLNLMRMGIELVYTASGKTMFSYHTSLYELTKSYKINQIIENMIEDLHQTAQSLKETGDNQNVMITGKDNPYAGKMLFDVMENATDKDVMEFLKYVNARPFIYMGGRWKFSEVFATWVVNGAPQIVEKK